MKKYLKNILAAGAYFLGPFTALPILVLRRKNSFIRFHCYQAIVFFFVTVFGYLLLSLTLVGLLVAPFFLIFCFVMWLVLMYKALRGEKYRLLFVGKVVATLEKIIKRAAGRWV